ncbi:MAG TPA: hypothetical protein VGT07_11525 [Steroidobacteraceae bacterium]|nr:hypothetical protein [Steroidobacteraceae bacterium]
MSDQTQLMTKRPAAAGPRMAWMARLAALLREFGPYLAIELILPGGSLIALLLWFCRRHGMQRRPVAAALADSVTYVFRQVSSLVTRERGLA